MVKFWNPPKVSNTRGPCFEGHEALEMSFQDAYPSLLQEHPDQWVAWGKDGVFGVSDSEDVLLRKMRAKNLTAKDVVFEYLDSNPTALIL